MFKNILFDLGGVLLKIDMQRTVEAFAGLGLKVVGHDGNSPGVRQIFENLETGLDTESQFRENLRKMLTGQPSDDEIDHAWNAMLIDFFPGTVEYLNELKSGYNLYLLSNTNALHLKRFRAIFFDDYGFPFDNLFKKTYYSHEIGYRKPDPAAYLKVLEDAGLNPVKTLFVDDLKINTDAAAKLGMKVLNIEAGTLLPTLKDYLQKV
jgi:putative hydrolase of the HAD superfamily